MPGSVPPSRPVAPDTDPPPEELELPQSGVDDKPDDSEQVDTGQLIDLLDDLSGDSGDLDDSSADDLVIGVDLATLDDGLHDNEPASGLAVEATSLLSLPSDSHPGDDELGTLDGESTWQLSIDPLIEGTGDEEGPSDASGVELASLPALDGGSDEDEDETDTGSILTGVDDHPITHAENFLTTNHRIEGQGAAHQLLPEEPLVVATGTGLFIGPPDGSRRSLVDGAVNDVVRFGSKLFCATYDGRVGEAGESRRRLGHGKGPACLAVAEGALLVLDSSGQLHFSEDGDHFTSLCPGDERLAALGTGHPLRAVRSLPTPRLIELRGQEQHDCEARGAEGVLETARPLLESRGDLVMLASDSAGVLISTDGGKSFAPVRGCNYPSAILSSPDGLAWAALVVASEDCVYLVRIDPQSRDAQVVARIDALTPGVEAPEVDRLVWDEGRGLIWVLGDFGAQALRVRQSSSSD